jgi:hypothetical protein
LCVNGFAFLEQPQVACAKIEENVKRSPRREFMVDPDILLLAIVNMSEGVRALTGDKGAKAVLRGAGRQAGPKPLESLIGHFPEVLNKEVVERGKIIYKYS